MKYVFLLTWSISYTYQTENCPMNPYHPGFIDPTEKRCDVKHLHNITTYKDTTIVFSSEGKMDAFIEKHPNYYYKSMDSVLIVK